MKYLDKEEKDLIDSYERGEWKSAKKKEQAKYVRAAKENIAKNKRRDPLPDINFKYNS